MLMSNNDHSDLGSLALLLPGSQGGKETRMPKILVVDDRDENRFLLASILGPSGYAVIEACDGAEALAAVDEHRPDLIVTDILMPTMDGFEFVRQLRAKPALAATPVVFCTAHYMERDARKLAGDCGVVEVL